MKSRMPRFANVAIAFVISFGAAVSTTGCSSEPTPPAGSLFPAAWRYGADVPSATGTDGMVVTADVHGSRVGVEILEAGGNAVDAAVAVCFALAVTFPEAGNIGGGGFLVLRMADGREAALDFREKAPLAATREMYLDDDGNVTNRSLYGALAAGVPGTVMGMWEVHEKYGSLSWQTVLAPAIRLAEEGFEVHEPLRESFAYLVGTLAALDATPAETRPTTAGPFSGTVEKFLQDGQPLPLGHKLHQPDLAATLWRIAGHGPGGFYGGETADVIVREMERSGGIITREDLAAYDAAWREPVRFRYRDHTVLTMPPTSSGGVTMAEIANILSGYDLSAIDWSAPDRIHLMAEAMKRAYADRNSYLGDPGFVDMPIDRMISAEYAAQRRSDIRLDAATPSAEVAPGLGPIHEGDHTTHYSIVDGEGNAVSVTTTINTRFGSLVTVHGAGFLLNNEMDDFTAKPGVPNWYGLVQGEANAIAPGKRMLSSMTPTIVLDPDDNLFLLTGTPGGSTIITIVFQTISNAIDYGMELPAAVGAPRIHHQHLPDLIRYEFGGLTLEAFAGLQERGHNLRPYVALGNVQAIMVLPDRTLVGVADPRGAGVAMGYDR